MGSGITNGIIPGGGAHVLDTSVSQLNGHIVTPGDQAFVLIQNAEFPFNINQLVSELASGTLTAAIKIDGVDVTDISAVAVSDTEDTSTASGAFAVAIGAKVTLVVSAGSTPVDFSFSLKYTRT